MINQIAIVVDTGPLVAVVDSNDTSHKRCRQALLEIPQRTQLLSVAPVLTEAFHLLRRARIEHNKLFELLQHLQIDLIDINKKVLERAGSLMDKYQDRPMDFADACLVAASEQHSITTIMTLDRDFEFYSPAHIKHFKLLP